MLARAVGFVDRFAITGLYAGLGLLNAQSWPYLLVFISFGAAVDIWLVEPFRSQPPKAFELLTPEELQREHAKWHSLLPYVIGLPLLGISLLLALRLLAQRNPDLLVAIGPAVYGLTSPFISLSRLHYQDLIAHGLPERAAVVAVNYAGMFCLFYLALGPWLAAMRNMGLGSHPWRNPPRDLKTRVSLWIAPPALILGVLFILWVTTWMSIDFADEDFGRRHINRNVAKYDSFFWELAFCLVGFATLVPMLYVMIRWIAARVSRRPV